MQHCRVLRALTRSLRIPQRPQPQRRACEAAPHSPLLVVVGVVMQALVLAGAGGVAATLRGRTQGGREGAGRVCGGHVGGGWEGLTGRWPVLVASSPMPGLNALQLEPGAPAGGMQAGRRVLLPPCAAPAQPPPCPAPSLPQHPAHSPCPRSTASGTSWARWSSGCRADGGAGGASGCRGAGAAGAGGLLVEEPHPPAQPRSRPVQPACTLCAGHAVAGHCSKRAAAHRP